MYQALYRKWRPKTFDDVVGQSHITRTLKNQIISNHLSHAYLFTGTRGTGKTTCAKLLSKAVNCLSPIEGNPCGHCAACTGIDDGSILDVVELDAASNNGVDQVRALREEAVYAPTDVKYKVYIIDEVHMLSVGAFNALLKTLEEPPEHVIFILATTELHKVPATILSRCQRFSFKRIQASDIQNRLLYIAQAENIKLTEDGAAILARLSDGALRDALSLLDQCSISGDVIDKNAVLNVLGLAGNTKTARIMDYICKHNTAKALSEFSELYSAGKDVSAVLSELSELVRDLLLHITAGGNVSGLSNGDYDEVTLNVLSKNVNAIQLVRMSKLLQDTLIKLRSSVNQRNDAELCIIQLCDSNLDDSVMGMSERLSKLENAYMNGYIPQGSMQGNSQGGNLPPFVEPSQQMEGLVTDMLPPEITDEQIIPPIPEDPTDTADIADIMERHSEVNPINSNTAPTMADTETFHYQTTKTSRDKKISRNDFEFWKALLPSLRYSMSSRIARAFLHENFIQGVYSNGNLMLYTIDETTRLWFNNATIKNQVERSATAQAGYQVNVFVEYGEPPIASTKSNAFEDIKSQSSKTDIEQKIEQKTEFDPLSELILFANSGENKDVLIIDENV